MEMLPLGDNGLGVIHALGYGVGTAWFKSAGTERDKALQDGVLAALDAGFRHIDEAEMYANESSSGKAICDWLARTGTPREELFITSKVSPDSLDEPGVEAICRQSLSRMGLSYFDLYLVHAPVRTDGTLFKRSLQEVWQDTEALVDAGLVKAIGVSNFRIGDLEAIYDAARIKPVCNQVEANPYLQQTKLLKWCSERSILVAAYCPLGSLTNEKLQGGPVDAVVQAAAERLGKTPAQVLLRWNYQTGRCVLTTTSKPDRLQEFLSIFEFELPDQDVQDISAAGESQQRRIYWTQCPQFPADPSQGTE